MTAAAPRQPQPVIGLVESPDGLRRHARRTTGPGLGQGSGTNGKLKMTQTGQYPAVAVGAFPTGRLRLGSTAAFHLWLDAEKRALSLAVERFGLASFEACHARRLLVLWSFICWAIGHGKLGASCRVASWKLNSSRKAGNDDDCRLEVRLRGVQGGIFFCFYTE